jgi:AraC family transcriptional regulator of adaptative response / DNA-3-methyladenine glycosylase II
MTLDRHICYRALRTRDRRFDGRFFTGVTSTGVYCRPVCPARTPKRDNCVFFPHAAAAEEAGFRPCLRCRPETSPGTPAWQGASATVSRALRLIDAGALDGGGVDDLAQRLGIGARHLRRLFVEHLGATPLVVAMTRRVHFAKRLLEETHLPIMQVALSAGFNNARRFNAAFRKCFDRPPRAIRCAAREARIANDDGNGGAIRLRLSYRPPLAWGAMLAYLGPRAIPGVEEVAGATYRRTIALDGVEGVLAISPGSEGDQLVLRTPVAAAPRLFEVVERVRTFLDLTADPGVIEDQLAGDPDLARLGVPNGLRVPGAWDRFELAVRAVLGQQVTVKGATRLSGRFVRAHGRKLIDSSPAVGAKSGATKPDSLGWIVPTPEDVARASTRSLAAIGIPIARAVAIRGLARAVADGAPVLEPAADLEQAVARLTALEGIGEWTAHYIAMRALREPDAFPSGDLGLRRALAHGDKPLTPRALARRSEIWRPWRAYAAVRLWTALSLRAEKK